MLGDTQPLINCYIDNAFTDISDLDPKQTQFKFKNKHWRFPFHWSVNQLGKEIVILTLINSNSLNGIAIPLIAN